MNPIAVLVLVAIAEAVIWLWRLRAGVGNSRWHAALSTVGVCATRVAFLWAGVTATLKGDHPLIAAAAYCLAAGLSTLLVHPKR